MNLCSRRMCLSLPRRGGIHSLIHPVIHSTSFQWGPPRARCGSATEGLCKQQGTADNLMKTVCKWVLSVTYKLSMQLHQCVMHKRSLSDALEIFPRLEGLNCILKDELESVKGSWDWVVERHPRQSNMCKYIKPYS